MSIEFEGAPHPFLLVEGRRRWVVIRRADGRLEDLGFVMCHHLLPDMGTIGANGGEVKMRCAFEDMRPGYLFRYEGRRGGEWTFLPRTGEPEIPKDLQGDPLRIDGVHSDLGPETWYLDELAREQIYPATEVVTAT